MSTEFKAEKYKEVIALSVLILLLAGFFISKLVPVIQNYYNLTQQVKSAREELSNLKSQLTATKEKYEHQKAENTKVLKNLYAPKETDLDNDSLFHDICNDILEMISLNGIKTNSLKYRSNPEDDSFISTAEKNMYKVDELEFELISDYTNFEDLLRGLYKYPYFLKIMNIKITPYLHNPKIIIINFVTRLYSKSMPDGQ